tara:strand:- start:240 stop:1049 length:810 start_codon:yes stop_codon:yes gene_type:complete
MSSGYWLIGLLIASLFSSCSVSACTLKMGYRTNERPPLISAHPDNSGLYQHFYQTMAAHLGCQLEIVRGPKKRILKLLEDGEIDFYPGFNFNEYRAVYTYYIETGFPGGEVGISRLDFSDINSLKDLEGSTILQSLGSPNFVRDLENIRIYAVPEMTIDKAVSLLRKKRGDFYIYNRASLLYYLKVSESTDIKVHPNCCGGVEPLYLGFSRRSHHYQETPNPGYDANQDLGPSNFPVSLRPGSKAFQIQKVLKEMKDSGETDLIYSQYY